MKNINEQSEKKPTRRELLEQWKEAKYTMSTPKKINPSASKITKFENILRSEAPMPKDKPDFQLQSGKASMGKASISKPSVGKISMAKSCISSSIRKISTTKQFDWFDIKANPGLASKLEKAFGLELRFDGDKPLVAKEQERFGQSQMKKEQIEKKSPAKEIEMDKAKESEPKLEREPEIEVQIQTIVEEKVIERKEVPSFSNEDVDVKPSETKPEQKLELNLDIEAEAPEIKMMTVEEKSHKEEELADEEVPNSKLVEIEVKQMTFEDKDLLYVPIIASIETLEEMVEEKPMEMVLQKNSPENKIQEIKQDDVKPMETLQAKSSKKRKNYDKIESKEDKDTIFAERSLKKVLLNDYPDKLDPVDSREQINIHLSSSQPVRSARKRTAEKPREMYSPSANDYGSGMKYIVTELKKGPNVIEKIMTPVRTSKRLSGKSPFPSGNTLSRGKKQNDLNSSRYSKGSVKFAEDYSEIHYIESEVESIFKPVDEETIRIKEMINKRRPTPYSKSKKMEESDEENENFVPSKMIESNHKGFSSRNENENLMNMEFRKRSSNKPGLRGVTTPFKDITNEKLDNVIVKDVKVLIDNEQESSIVLI